MFTLVFVCGKGEVRDVHWTSVGQIMVRGVHGTSVGQMYGEGCSWDIHKAVVL